MKEIHNGEQFARGICVNGEVAVLSKEYTYKFIRNMCESLIFDIDKYNIDKTKDYFINFKATFKEKGDRLLLKRTKGTGYIKKDNYYA